MEGIVSSEYKGKLVIEGMLYINEWMPGNKSTIRKYSKRYFVLDLPNSTFAYYSDVSKTIPSCKYNFSVRFFIIIGYNSSFRSSVNKIFC